MTEPEKGLGRRRTTGRIVDDNGRRAEGIDMDLTGQRVVVLGGTSGIGLATADAAAKAGAEVTVVSARQTSVRGALERLPAGTRGEVADLTDDDLVGALFDGLGAIDHMVFTAGDALALAPLDRLELKRARDFFGLRYFGTLAAVRAAAPHLRTGGSITLTTGIAKDRPRPGWSVAASICGAIEALTRALAVELAPIRVNAVAPGVIRTPLWGEMSEADRERLYRDLATTTPVGRVGAAEDAARAYLYLLSQPFATGTVLTVDGGSVLV
jgi:NAD(P)-dependent dehydrogenase (short-subunit alcohol dehydrogenase family)